MAEIRRGRIQFTSVVIGGLLFVLLLAAGVWLRGAEFKVITQIGRPIILLVLAFLALSGRRWARTAVAVWLGLLSIGTGITAIVAGFSSPMWSVIALVFTAGLVYGAYLMYTSADIEAYLALKGAKATGPAA